MAAENLTPAIQFYDNLDEIGEKLERRFSMKMVWESLSNDGKYTGDYTHFCRLVKKEFPDKNKKKKSVKPVAHSKPDNKKESTQRVNEKKGEEEITEEGKGPMMFLGDLHRPKEGG